MSGHDHETPIERAEDRLKEDLGEVEEAAWETVYEARDMVKDAVEKITHPHHNHHEQDK
jgi:hypothetical protein